MICANPKCGKDFVKTRYNRIFCSKNCQQNSYWIKVTRPLKVCVQCGKEFQCKSNNDKYCSDYCAIRFRYYLKRKDYIKECPVCKKNFNTRSSIKKYCSKKCHHKTTEYKKYQSDLAKRESSKKLQHLVYKKRLQSGKIKEWKKKSIEKLSYGYINEKLKRVGFKNPTDELREQKRLVIKIKRKLKEHEKQRKTIAQ
jgi:hypothetical protein